MAYLENLPIEKIRTITFPPPPALVENASGLDPELLRLNLNEAHLPPSPKALQAAAAAIGQGNRYPDHGCTMLGAEISRRTGIAPDRISFGNGSGEILIALAMLSINPGDAAVMPAPTFPTCGKGVQIAGGRIIEVPLRPDGSNDVAAMLNAITPETRLFYLCTPNNPTGAILSAGELERAAHEVPVDILLVIDEAYYEFAAKDGGPDVLSILRHRKGPRAVTRSFSKAYCLAGLRVGYALTGDRTIRDALWQLRPNFNIGRASIAAATAAIQDDDYLSACLAQTVTERNCLKAELERLGYEAMPSFANFLTVKAPQSADSIARQLAARNILVQSLPWPGGNGSLRVTIGSRADTDRLVKEIREMRSP